MNEFIIYFLGTGLLGIIVELITAKIEKRKPTSLSVATSFATGWLLVWWYIILLLALIFKSEVK